MTGPPGRSGGSPGAGRVWFFPPRRAPAARSVRALRSCFLSLGAAIDGFRFVLGDLGAGTGVVAEPGDRRDDVLLGHFRGAEVARRSAEAKYEDSVTDLEDVGQVVADHDDA